MTLPPSVSWCRRAVAIFLGSCITPWVALWAWWQQRRILRHGRPPTEIEVAMARKVGVQAAEKIRILAVPCVPLPVPAWLQRLGRRFDFACENPAGMTLGYGVFVISAFDRNLHLLGHEFVHVGQYERLHGLLRFLWRYLYECLTYGYEPAPLECEAREKSRYALD